MGLRIACASSSAVIFPARHFSHYYRRLLLSLPVRILELELVLLLCSSIDIHTYRVFVR